MSPGIGAACTAANGDSMHKSRLSGFIIDCQTADLESAAEFWSAALGLPVIPASTKPEDAAYRSLDTGPEGLDIQVQQVEHPSRVHLDIETDNVDAEVERLVQLGAKKLGMVRSWCVLEAPTGQRFCVVRQQQRRTDFAAQAHTWK
jgi:predicted enzyme related to lactoylglutathione lyase